MLKLVVYTEAELQRVKQTKTEGRNERILNGSQDV
jgi:hypothetical protein